MSYFVLKLVAAAALICDYADRIFDFSWSLPLPGALLLTAAGQMAAPLYLFLLANGYRHTASLKGYFARLVIFAVIAQYPYVLFIRAEFAAMGSTAMLADLTLNPLFTLLLSLAAIAAFERLGQRSVLLAAPLMVLAAFLAELLRCEGGWRWVLLCFAFHWLRDLPRLLRAVLWLFVAVFLRLGPLLMALRSPLLLPPVLAAVAGLWLGALLSVFYNEQKGPHHLVLQIGWYFFYPLQLLALALLGR